MGNPKGTYYTFRLSKESPLTIQAIKWDGFSDEPVATYNVMPEVAGPLGGCDCPAWKRDCKHFKCVEEAIRDGKVDALHMWRWIEGPKGGWIEDDEFTGLGDIEV